MAKSKKDEKAVASKKAAPAKKRPPAAPITSVRCTLQHMRGKSVKVDGVAYEVEATGLIKGLEPAHALKLLKMNGFASDGPISRESRAATVAEALPDPTGNVKLLTGDGRTLDEALEAAAKEGAEGSDAGSGEDEGESPTIENDEWPDPDAGRHSLAFLRTMADAHGVDHTPEDTRETLAGRIKTAMYG